jgi:hypothetical protein
VGFWAGRSLCSWHAGRPVLGQLASAAADARSSVTPRANSHDNDAVINRDRGWGFAGQHGFGARWLTLLAAEHLPVYLSIKAYLQMPPVSLCLFVTTPMPLRDAIAAFSPSITPPAHHLAGIVFLEDAGAHQSSVAYSW